MISLNLILKITKMLYSTPILFNQFLPEVRFMPNDKKTKGGLKMNSYNAIMKGGKNGSILMINNSMESKIHKRMTLPIEDRYHMPPKSRTQPSKEEIELIKIWIDNSALKMLWLVIYLYLKRC